jgi:hypothetical protein
MKKIIILLSVLAIIFFFSCKKKEASCPGVSGGNVTLDLVPQHHGKPVPNRAAYLDSAFIKYNAVQPTGYLPSDFDLVVSGTAGTQNILVPGMQCGQYYIYMTGFDTVYNKRVVGGTPIDFTSTSGQVQFLIPITESL